MQKSVRFLGVFALLAVLAVFGLSLGVASPAAAEEYVGIGIGLADASGPGLDKGEPVGEDVFMVTVVDVFSGGPADAAGVLKGDYIHAVDGKLVRDMGKMDDVVAAIRGSSAPTVALTIHRYPGAAYWEKGEVLEFTITKAKVSHEPPAEE